MAEDGVGSRSQHSRQPPSFSRHFPVANGIRPLMKQVQSTVLEPVLKRVLT
jgi:hypothetical protein